jgi:hypothetical protein
MDLPEETDKETFLALMLKKRPEYAIVWDVHGRDVQEFHARVWVVQYVAVKDEVVFYSQSRHYAKRAKAMFHLQKIEHITDDSQWITALPDQEEQFKPLKFYAPDIMGEDNPNEPIEIELEDFINKMLKFRPPFAVLWNATLEDIEYMASRVYVVSYMPVIGNTLYYSYAKHFAVRAQKLFQIPNRKKIDIQNPQL